jgi:hypothetical protein
MLSEHDVLTVYLGLSSVAGLSPPHLLINYAQKEITMTSTLKSHPLPALSELREFYLCGIRTGYGSYKQASKAAESWSDHTTYDCEYCPGIHHVKSEALTSDEKLSAHASKHWGELLTRVYGEKETDSVA